MARALAVAGVVAVCCAALLGVRLRESQPYAGDEPHYLVISNSLIDDGDVDVKNDYALERYLPYMHAPIDPHVNKRIFTPASPHWYSQHGVGLAALLVPGVVLDGAHGASIEMVLVALAVLVLAYLWARRFTRRVWPALCGALVLGISPFFLGLDGRIFPDLATAVLLLACLLILERPSGGPWQLLLLGILVGSSPWFHFKNALPFASVAAVALVQLVRSGRALAALLVPIAVSAVGYEIATRVWYRSWLPSHMYSSGNHAFAMTPWRGVGAVSFDGAHGLLTNDPALLLVLAGLPVWLRLWRGPFLRVAFVVGPSILLQSTFNDWSGGYAPSARYALQFVPALVPAVALFLQEARGVARALAAVLIGVQWALAVAFAWIRPPFSLAGQPSAFLAVLDRHLGFALTHALPTFGITGAVVHGRWQLAAWAVAAVLVCAYGWRLGRELRVRRAPVELGNLAAADRHTA